MKQETTARKTYKDCDRIAIIKEKLEMEVKRKQNANRKYNNGGVLNKLEIDITPNNTYIRLNGTRVTIQLLENYEGSDLWRMEFKAKTSYCSDKSKKNGATQ